jgi:adenylate kinase family enzyme
VPAGVTLQRGNVRRIVVIGSGGAGKSTLATQLGAALGLPVIHLDALYWRPGWVPTPEAEWRARVAELVARDAWVMDGNYGGTLDLRLAACDGVVFLDLPRWVCLGRVLRRRLRHAGRARPDMADGCPEQLTWEFLRWIWDYPRRRRPAILRRLGALPPHCRVTVLSSRSAVAGFVAGLPRPAAERGVDAPARRATP